MAQKIEKALRYALGAIAGLVLGGLFSSLELTVPYLFEITGAIFGFITAYAITVEREAGEVKAESIAYNDAILVLAHQTRTSMTAASWGIETVLKKYDEKFEQVDKDLLKNIVTEVKSIAMQSVGLIDVATVDWGKLSSTFGTVSLDDVEKAVNETVIKFRAEAEKNHIDLKVTMLLDHGKKLEADMLRIRFILENLLENAIHYSVDGKDKKEILVAAGNDNDFLRLSVADSGMGIPRIDQERIFTRFYRAKNAKEKIATGTGIGLFLCKQYVSLHHGTISFQSEEGVGTTFFINIPLNGAVRPEEFFEKI